MIKTRNSVFLKPALLNFAVNFSSVSIVSLIFSSVDFTRAVRLKVLK